MLKRKAFSPLRYPGGKACLSNFLAELANLNGIRGGTYLELYAGGSGAALNLLFNNVFSNIHINDFDYHIYAMWYSMLNYPGSFIKKIKETEISIQEWHRQQNIFELGSFGDVLDVGFATFFLNRTNRSGILFKAGPIGGFDQTGNYKLDVRFNKTELINRIEKISEYRQQIQLTNLDALEIIKDLNTYHKSTQNLLAYLDPPYYKKGKLLYLNNYSHKDHENLAEAIGKLNAVRWLITYDNVKEIKAMFSNYRMSNFNLSYTLQSKSINTELLIFSENLIVGADITVNRRTEELVLI
jgi:DNA adenine methylase